MVAQRPVERRARVTVGAVDDERVGRTQDGFDVCLPGRMVS